ncbi:MAG: hypothetical protein E7617_06140 [Ruminococcaceae bacterium]|nr:hypothetical protein [Oscillospiraceae bacterium]
MKKISWQSRVVVALLMVVVMLFSTLAVTAFAANEPASGSSDVTKEFDTAWYTFEYTSPKGGNPAQLDIRIKTDYAKYKEITKSDVIALKDQVIALVTQYAMDTILGDVVFNETASEMVFTLAADEGNGKDISSMADSLLEKFLKSYFQADSLEELDIDDKVFIKEKIESVQNGGFDLILQKGIDEYIGADELTDSVKEEILDVVDNILPDVIDAVYTVDSVEEFEKLYAKEIEEGTVVVPEIAEDATPDEVKAALTEETKKVTEGEFGVKANVNSKIEENVVSVQQNGGFALNKETILNFIKAFNSVSVKDNIAGTEMLEVFSFEEGASVNLSAIKALVLALPRPAEMKDYTDEDFEKLFSYDVSLDFAFGTFDIRVNLGLEGDCSEIRTLMSIVESHIDVEIKEDGTYSVELLIPDEFASILNRAINKAIATDKVPEYIKHKAFRVFSKDGADIEAFVSELTFDEIITVLEAIDFDGLLNSDFLERHFGEYFDFSKYTEDQIINKVKEFEGLYNKAKKLVLIGASKIPDKFMDNTIFDVYEGNGVFHAKEDANFNIVNVLKNLLPSDYEYLADFVSGVIGREEMNISAELTVKFLDIYRVTYMLNDTTVHLDGFLPVGGNVAYFGNEVLDENGKPVEWVDANGNTVTVMPECDIVLYPKGEFWVAPSEDINENYLPGADYTLSATVSSTGNPSFTYQWYKDGKAIEGATAATYTITDATVASSGVYTCEVTAWGKTVTVSTNVTINKMVLDFSELGVKWNYTGAFTYNGTKHEVVLENLPDEYVSVVYSGNTATNAGNYTASYTLTYDEANIEVKNAPEAQNWVINPETIGLDNVSWDRLVFTYAKGVKYLPKLVNLPENVTVEYEGDSQGNAGNYVIKAVLSTTSNYALEGADEDGTVTLTEAWNIETLKIDFKDVVWSTGTLTYNGEEQKVELENLPAGFVGTVTYANNKATNVTKLTATYSLEYDDEGGNVEVINTPAALTWEILPKTVDFTGVSWTDVALTYNGEEQKVELKNLPTLPADFNLAVSGNVGTDAANYTATYSYSSNYSVTGGPATSTSWTIAPQTITLSGITWDYNGAFTYDKTDKTVLLVGVPANVTVSYDNNKATLANEAGYAAVATLTPVNANYTLDGQTEYTLTWVINKAPIDMIAAKWNYSAPFVQHNGTVFTVEIENLPEGVVANYTNNSASAIGEYTATFTLAYDKDNYKLINSALADLEWKIIEPADPECEHNFVKKDTNLSYYVEGTGDCQTGKQFYYLCEHCNIASTTETWVSDIMGDHTFSANAWKEEVAATCVATGTKAHQDCDVCHKHFEADGKTEIVDLTIAIDPDNHDMAIAWTGVEDGHYHECQRVGCEYHDTLSLILPTEMPQPSMIL